MVTPRPATPDDAAELTRLRVLMFGGLDRPGLHDPRWQEATRAFFAEGLADPSTGLRVFVVDKPDGSGLASCAIAYIYHRVPAPGNATGTGAYIGNVSTDVEHRRRGHARACMDALVAVCRAEGANKIELRASAEAEPMYEAMGFTRTPDPAMMLRY